MSYKNQYSLFKDIHPFQNTKIDNRYNAIQIGDAGETLVSFNLKKLGFCVIPTPQGSLYDHILDLNGIYLRIQTKSLSNPKNKMHYSFTRGFHASKTGVYHYNSDDFDISACVNLFDEKVLFSFGVNKNIYWSRSCFLKENATIDSLNSSINKFLNKNAA